VREDLVFGFGLVVGYWGVLVAMMWERREDVGRGMGNKLGETSMRGIEDAGE